MADDLTAADKAKIMDWVRRHWVTSKHCPICSHNHWIIGGHLVSPVTFVQGGMTFGGMTYPHFMLTCGNCGYTHFFNSVVAKIEPESEKKGGDSGDTS